MIEFDLTGRTDPGKGRQRNEDAWALDNELGLIVVADGMGGHPAGDVASRLAVETVRRELAGSDGGRTARSETREHEDPGARMADAVRSANRRILEDGEERPERQGMGTTLTVLRLDPEGGRFEVGHVGDSRAYRFRDDALEPLTRDDTPLQEAVDAGRMTREEARIHPMSNILSQALGTMREVDPQVIEGRVRPGDLYLLCSDGLVAVLSEEAIEELLSRGKDDPLDELANRLIEATLDGGAPDNVTVALARVRGEG